MLRRVNIHARIRRSLNGVFGLAVLAVLVASLVEAKPNLGEFRDLEGIRLYQDHQKLNKWYISPAPPVIADQNGTPDYGLDLIRYKGRSGTGDQEEFWVRGVLNVRVERQRKAGSLASLRKELKWQLQHHVLIQSMPVSHAKVRIQFGDLTREWEQAARWSGGSLMLPLDEVMSQVLWKSIETGQTLVSISVDESFSGLRLENEDWKPGTVGNEWTLPLEFDLESESSHFRRTDVGGRLQTAYTGVELYCFDFVEGLDPNLYAKIVEIAIPTAGRDLIKTVRFDSDSEYRSHVQFALSKDLDTPYRYRITRIFMDGMREVGQWQLKHGETMLDVTEAREPESGGNIDDAKEGWVIQ